MERVKSSDVLDVSHEAKRTFRGTIVGHFRRVGPNAWDDYQFIRTTTAGSSDASESSCSPEGSSDLQQLDILPTVPLQLEPHGPEIRIRSAGRVIRVRWLPAPDDLEAMGADAGPREIRQYFVEHCLTPLAEASGLGAAAVVARKLSDS